MVYVNCYKNPQIEVLFAEDKDINRILLGLSAMSGQEITKGETFIFLDEAQEIPDVIASLKYFCEDAPEIHVAIAGSLLGIMNMENISFPTGKVDIMHMYPMTFPEFLEAVGEQKKAELLQMQSDKSVVNALLPSYTELLRQYYFVGGMPEAVAEFIASRDPSRVRKLQNDLLAEYDADIAKHAGAETQRTRLVFNSIPSQLAKENKKFIFGALRKGARGADFDKAIQWLTDAGLAYKVCRLSKVEMPLSYYIEQDIFKLYLLDTGLLGAMAKVPPAMMLIGNNIFSEFKGSFTENYVLSQIVPVSNTVIAYYAKNNSTMELDFIVQTDNGLLPIEVKAEENVRSKSMRQFITVDKAGSDLRGYRFSMKGYEDQDRLSNIPLFAVNSFINNA